MTKEDEFAAKALEKFAANCEKEREASSKLGEMGEQILQTIAHVARAAARTIREVAE